MAKDFSRLTGMARYRATLQIAMRFALQLWWLAKTSRFRSPKQLAQRRHRLYAAQAQTFVRLATQMGGLVIKLGQHISTRVDLLPTEYTIELARLQDAVPAVPVAAIRAEIERELGQEMAVAYRSFDDQPVAAASLGQVHRAQLPGGAPVAVKVLRPGIEELVRTDLRSLKTILRWLERLTSAGKYLDLEMFYTEFEDTLLAELDMEAEARNIERFQASFLLNPNIDMPRVYWDWTRRRVLTMELMGGVKISALDQLDAAGIDRRQLARDLLDVYLRMILRDGFFHADPHPGNILVRQDGVIELIDFGMVGTVPEKLSGDAPRLALALFNRNWRTAAQLLDRMGFLHKDADQELLAKALEPIVDQILGAGSRKKPLDQETTEELRLFMYSQPFQLPGQTAFLGKTLINLIGVALQLDPEMNLMEELVPLIRESVADAGGFGGLSGLSGLPGAGPWLGWLDSVLGTSGPGGNGGPGAGFGPGDEGPPGEPGWLTGLTGLARWLSADSFAVPRRAASGALDTGRNLTEAAAKANRGELVVRLSRAQRDSMARTEARQTGRIVKAVTGGIVVLSGVQLLVAGLVVPLGASLTGLGGLIMLFQWPSGRERRRRSPHGQGR
ncbi:MAG: hypothetical protein LBJ02_06160 [Bifidobacteriaceae bacterium]|jgi:predicted unusual protein kinase regulating ubiquinone biosynthesis (AarF/ABC1/UbiB family)|nr:hypothetical protein [Bifidobacteriaceae bacterium]